MSKKYTISEDSSSDTDMGCGCLIVVIITILLVFLLSSGSNDSSSSTTMSSNVSTQTPLPTSTPTPTPQIRTQLIEYASWQVQAEIPDSLNVEFPIILQCRESSDSDNFSQDYIVVMTMGNMNNDKWANAGEATLYLETASGTSLEEYPVSFILSANGNGWAIPNENLKSNVLYVEGSRAAVFRLVVSDVEWREVGELRESYVYGIGPLEIKETNRGILGLSPKDYPQYSISIRVTNHGDLIMNQVNIRAVLEDGEGRPVGAFFAEEGNKDIPYDQSANFELVPIMERCSGARSSSGYILQYWLEFQTLDGEYVTYQGKFEIHSP
jgi:hypothetical protein